MGITDVGNKYRISRDNLGVVNSVNRLPDGASLFYYPQTREFDELDPMTVELREWEAENQPLDMSDHEPDPPPPDDDPGDDDGDGDDENIIF